MTYAQPPQAAPAPPPEPPPPPRYVPPPDSRIEDLMDRLEVIKARKKAAEMQVKEADELLRSVKAAIANEVTREIPVTPEQNVVLLAAGPHRPEFRLSWITPTKINREKLKEKFPAAFGACLEWGTPYWDLRKADR